MPRPAVRSIPICGEGSHACLLHPCAFPRDVGMAAVAFVAVLAQMPVILVVTAAALLRHFHRAGRLVMAFGALQLGMGAEQRKMRFLGVIENPERPAVGRMAALALLAQASLVHVIVRMAVDAGRGRPKGQSRVALRA